jgi:uncharacterized membrane protein
MTATPTTDSSRHAVSWRRIALPASTILNLFLLALIAGYVWHLHHGAAQRLPVARILSNMEARLDRRDASAFRAVMEQSEPGLGQGAQSVSKARRNLEAQLTAEPFDQQAARHALVEWHNAAGQFLDRYGDTLIDALARVSPEGRRRLVKGESGR